MSQPEIRGVTWDLDGPEMPHWMAVRRLFEGGFWTEGPDVLLSMFAIIEGESGSYLQAWHANVQRNADRSIFYDQGGLFHILSVDLGFMQINTPVEAGTWLVPTASEVQPFIQDLFDAHPKLARADESVAIAYTLWKARGFKPWFAYMPGTPKWHQKKRYGSKAVADFLIHSYVGKVDPQGEPATYYPELIFSK